MAEQIRSLVKCILRKYGYPPNQQEKATQTASRCLQELERIGILVGEKRGRETVYRHPRLMEVLTK